MARFTRFLILASILASGMLVATKLLVQAFPQAALRAQRQANRTGAPGKTAQPAARSSRTSSSSWSARLSRDAHTITLDYAGTTWVAGLRVEVTAGNPRLSSTAPGTRLAYAPVSRPGQSIFKVQGPVP